MFKLSIGVSFLGALLSVGLLAQSTKKPLTNTDVVEMVRAGLAESTVILSIKSSETSFDTSPQALIELKKGGVSQNIMDAMLSAPSAAPVPAYATPNRASSGDGKALMAKVINALGGEKAINAVKAIRITSTMEVKTPSLNTTLGLVLTSVYPDQVQVSVKSTQFNSVTVYQPDGAFILVDGKPQPFPEPAQQEILSINRMSIIYISQHANDPKYTFTISGSEKIGEIETAILEISTEGRQARWNIDPVSGRLIRVTRMLAVAGGPALTRFEYGDWRTISGVAVPFKVFQNGVSSGEIKSYEINPEIPLGFFDKPSGARAASVNAPPQATSVASGCPVEILHVNPHEPVSTSEDPWGWALRVKYRNVTSKEIIAEKFAANFFNALHEKKESAWNYTSDQKIKAGETKNTNWGDGVYVNEIGMRIGAEVWPVKMMFADETFWEDDGSMKCKSAIWATPPK